MHCMSRLGCALRSSAKQLRGLVARFVHSLQQCPEPLWKALTGSAPLHAPVQRYLFSDIGAAVPLRRFGGSLQ